MDRGRIQRLERGLDLAGRAIARGRVLGETAADDHLEAGRHAPAQGVRVLVHDRAGKLRHRGAIEGQPSRGHLVEEHAQRPDVAPAIRAPAHQDFRWKVVGGSQDHPGGGEARVSPVLLARVAEALGQPEVEHHRPPFGRDHDVGALQIPMDHAPLVREGQRPRDLRPVPAHQRERKPPARDHLTKGFPFHELHREKQVPAVFAHVVHMGDVGMAEGGRGARLLEEPGFGVFVRHLVGGKNFQRQVAVETRVVGAIHPPHAAGAEEAQDSVVREGLVEKVVHEVEPRGAGCRDSNPRTGHRPSGVILAR